MTNSNRRTVLKGLGVGVAGATGTTLLTDATATAHDESADPSPQSEFRVDGMSVGHYEADGDFEEKDEFEFSLDPRTGFDVKFELSGVEPAANDDVRLGYSVILSDIVTGRLQMKSETKVDENASGGSMEFVWHGTPAGSIRLFNTGNWMKNTHSVYGIVTNAGDGGKTATAIDTVDPA